MKRIPPTNLRIGIDIGGTFTDFVYIHPQTSKIVTRKVQSTPHNPADAVISGLNDIIGLIPETENLAIQIIHGSTVATNTLLERKGASTAFITNDGFKDILHIGRQNRSSLYDIHAPKPEPLVSREMCFELAGRITKQGDIIQSLDLQCAENLVSILKSHDIQSVAIGFLFSFIDPTHETLVANLMRDAGFDVSCSSEIIPEYREYERYSTTVVNAYVSPIFRNYIHDLQRRLPDGSQLSIVQSNGGCISPEVASAQAVRCILSGPAGGIAGAVQHNALIDRPPSTSAPHLITFDMGGTSTDVSLIDEKPVTTKNAAISGLPIRIPMLDIQTIGAGGGSIAYVDDGGILRVGPESAGAYPGPACYGNSDVPTVTDANLVLGRLLPDKFLAGNLTLDADKSHDAVQILADRLGMDRYQVAEGIRKIVNSHMDKTIRVISIERGYDPKAFSLVSFGGAGGLHSADLAHQLNIPRVIIPQMASTFSAYGMLSADIARDYSKTIMLRGKTSTSDIRQMFDPLSDQAVTDFVGEGFDQESIRIEKSLDMRYQGQSFEIEVPFNDDYNGHFHQNHEHLYGYQFPEKPTEIVNLRIKALVESEKLDIQNELLQTEPAPIEEYRPVYFDNELTQTPVYNGLQLQPGNWLVGPAIIYLPDTTVVVPNGDKAFLDSYKNIQIEISKG